MNEVVRRFAVPAAAAAAAAAACSIVAGSLQAHAVPLMVTLGGVVPAPPPAWRRVSSLVSRPRHRGTARPIVPAPVLAGWASERAIAIAAADLTEADKAKAAEVVMACGGAVGSLPIILWQNEWMSASQFAAAVKDLEQLIIHEGEVRYDDDDDVSKRAFESSFEADVNIAHIVSDSRRFGSTEWIAAVTQGKGSSPIHAIEEVLLSVWGVAESEAQTAVVGEVNGSEICRSVTIYSRTNGEDTSEE